MAHQLLNNKLSQKLSLYYNQIKVEISKKNISARRNRARQNITDNKVASPRNKE